MSESQNQEVATAEDDTPQLKINDLVNVLQIIDAACSRGAFRGEEMTGVGQVRDRVNSFVEFISPKEDKEETEEATQAEPEPEPEKKTKSKGRKKSTEAAT